MGAIDVGSGKHESEMKLVELLTFEKRLRDKYDARIVSEAEGKPWSTVTGFSCVEGMCWTSVRNRLKSLGVMEDSYGNPF